MVGTMIVAAFAGVTTAAVAASAYLTAAAFAVNFAVSQIVSRIFSDAPSSPQDNGVRLQVPPSSANSIPIVYGDAYLGGTFVDAVLSENQKAMYYVLAVSSISPNGQFTFDTTDMYYGDRRIIFDTTDTAKVIKLVDEAGNEDTKINGFLWVGLYTSSQSGVISSANGWYAPSVVMGPTTPFTAYSIATAQQWPSTGRQMNGTAFAIVTLVYSRDADTTQLSPITFKVKQALNGTGVAKPGDVWYDYITNTVYGGAVPTAFVDSTNVAILNTYSDAIITFTNSSGVTSTQSRYRINGVLDAGQTVLSNIDKIVSACDSWMTYDAALGKWSIVVNKAETASYAFNDTNIIGDIRVSATDITSSINQIEAKFPFKENRDQPAFVYLETPSALWYPNEPVNKYTITYDMVNDSVQAQYLANRLLEQAREDLIVSFSTTYYGIQVDAGSVVSVTNSNYGWTNKLFRVTRVNEASLPDGSLGAKLELSEYSAAVYDDQTIQQYAPIANSDLPNVGYFSALTAPSATGFSNVAIPYFNVTVNIPATGRVTFVNLYYTTVATPASTDWKLLDQASTSNSQPFTNSSTFTFANEILPTGTYYFGYVVGNEVGQSSISSLSSSFAWSPTGVSGPFVDISGVTSFSKTSSNVYTPATATLTAIVANIDSPTYSWSVTNASPAVGSSSSITITPNATATSVVLQLTVNGSNLTAPIVKSVTMAVIIQVDKYETVNLYQWSTATPGNPSGTSTYTWATNTNSTYTGGNGWSVTVPTNPGTPGIYLYLASKEISANSVATTTTVDWSTGYSVFASSQNAVAGTQTAKPTVYQWAATIPTISGTSTYTWATGSFTPIPSGWSTTIATSTPGFTLWAATVTLVDSSTATTSTVSWTTASIIASGYAGSNGLSSRICYARVASNPTPVSGTITTTGNTSFPSSAQSTTTWGFAATWVASDPNTSSTDSLYQSDGIYNASTNQTSWSTPYISSLKVGQLSAVSTNTGSLTISGTLTSNTAAISGTTMTGSGGVLYSSGNFALGNSTTNITYNGTTVTLNGAFVSAGSLTSGNMTNGSAGNAWIQMGQSGTVIATLKSALNVRKVAVDTTLVNIAAQNNLDGNTTIWGHSANNAVGNGNGTTGSHTTVNTFDSWQRLGALGSGLVNAGVWGLSYADNTSSTAGVFQRYSGTSSASIGTLNKSIQLATASYCAYSPSGQGKIYIVDGNGPFTGFHEGMIDINSPVQVGDIVTDVSVFYRYNISNVLFNVAQSVSANQTRGLGVISSISFVHTGIPGILWVPVQTYTPGDMGATTTMTLVPDFNLHELQTTYKVVQVNAVGEGQINVCGQNGNIEAGDYIVTSNIAGKGMKQSDDVLHAYTIAKARESVSFADPTEIKMIACIYVSG